MFSDFRSISLVRLEFAKHSETSTCVPRYSERESTKGETEFLLRFMQTLERSYSLDCRWRSIRLPEDCTYVFIRKHVS